MRSCSSPSGLGYGKTRSSWISPRNSDFENDETAVAASMAATLHLVWRARSRADVDGGRADQAALPLLLEDVRGPAGHARACEHRREEVRRHVRVVEHDSRPELDVRGEHAVRAARLQLGQSGVLERLRTLEPRRADLTCGAAQHAGARVLGAVDAVAEAHQPLAA